MSDAPRPAPIFDTALARRRLARALRREPADFLLRRVAADMVERLAAVQRTFGRIADVGTPTPLLADAMRAAFPAAAVVRVTPLPEAGAIQGDAELLPLAPSLQGCNDLPGALVQLRRALKPDGLLLASLAGGRTLGELRGAFTEAEIAMTGGASPRVAPFADVRDMGGLLQRAGFALPVADSEALAVRYPDLLALMRDIRAMGAGNVLHARSLRPVGRALIGEAARLYAGRHADADGRIRATFEIVSLSGWAPHESQGKPAPRGSGKVSLAAALGDRSGSLGGS